MEFGGTRRRVEVIKHLIPVQNSEILGKTNITYHFTGIVTREVARSGGKKTNVEITI